jgi:hypothetical protein
VTKTGVVFREQRDDGHQSSTATHRLRVASAERGFNEEYLALCSHLNTKPRTIAVACPDQNGDIEAMQFHLKRRITQKLLLRGSRDFPSEEAYAAFVAELCRALNLKRGSKVLEELKLLRPLPLLRFPDTLEVTAAVSTFSTVRVKKCAYSVPARLIGARVQAFVSDKLVVIRHLGSEVARHGRIPGKRHQVNYRHVIKSLVRKPGAFARCQYREDLFPEPVFRHAYERLRARDEAHADRHYVALLDLAYDLGEQAVADAIGALLRDGSLPVPDSVQARMALPATPAPDLVAVFTPNLAVYDALITEVAS